jgi:thioesterase domain-containing protein/aryl carrier-like protein
LTHNGKIDRKALPDPDDASLIRSEYAGAQTVVQHDLVQIWQTLLSVAQVGINDNFFELGGDSIKAIQLVSKIRLLGYDYILTRDLFENSTIKKIATYIESIEKNLQKDLYVKREILLTINDKGLKNPIFFIPGGGGNLFSAYELSKSLANDQPFYVFQPHGSDGMSEPLQSISEIAAEYIKEMQKINTDGPYVVGGYSFGGLVAYEMTKQLTDNGYKVDKLLIFDKEAPNYDTLENGSIEKNPEEIIFNIAEMICEYYGLNAVFSPKDFENISKEAQLEILIRELGCSGITFSRNEILGFVKVYLNDIQLNTDYRLESDQKVNVQIILFKVNRPNDNDKSYGWENLSSMDVKIYSVNGSHLTFLKQPYIKEVAQYLDKELEFNH